MNKSIWLLDIALWLKCKEWNRKDREAYVGCHVWGEEGCDEVWIWCLEFGDLCCDIWISGEGFATATLIYQGLIYLFIFLE